MSKSIAFIPYIQDKTRYRTTYELFQAQARSHAAQKQSHSHKHKSSAGARHRERSHSTFRLALRSPSDGASAAQRHWASEEPKLIHEGVGPDNAPVNSPTDQPQLVDDSSRWNEADSTNCILESMKHNTPTYLDCCKRCPIFANWRGMNSFGTVCHMHIGKADFNSFLEFTFASEAD
jgi:hypothetical protein